MGCLLICYLLEDLRRLALFVQLKFRVHWNFQVLDKGVHVAVIVYLVLHSCRTQKFLEQLRHLYRRRNEVSIVFVNKTRHPVDNPHELSFFVVVAKISLRVGVHKLTLSALVPMIDEVCSNLLVHVVLHLLEQERV